MVRRVNLSLPDGFAERIEAQKPESIALTAFCALLIEQALTGRVDYPRTVSVREPAGLPVTTMQDLQAQQVMQVSPAPEVLGDSLEPKKNQQPLKQKKKRDQFSSKAISLDLVPDDLLDCQQLLPEFWAAKKGTRSEGVWNRVCGKLRAWTPEQRREALERAIANGWGDVFEPSTPRATQPSRAAQPSLTEQARALGIIQ